MAISKEQEINDLTLKATTALTEESEIQEAGGGIFKKSTLTAIERTANKGVTS